MGTPSDIQLHDMGLTPKSQADEPLGWGSWTRKTDIHTAILASDQPNKPVTNPMWKTAKEAMLANAVNCNMGIHTARLTAIVTGGNDNGTDKVLPDEYYICKKETGV